MKNIYTHQKENLRKTWLFILTFSAILIGLGYFLSGYFQNSIILYGMVAFTSLMSIWSYWFSDKMVLKMQGAKEISREDNREIFQMIEELTMKAGLPMPKVYIMNESQMNAFATGRNPKHSAVALTKGIIEKLNGEELKGVIAHELSHIGNRDMLVMTVAVVLGGFISIIADWIRMSSIFGGEGGDNNNSGPMVIVAILISLVAPIAAFLIQMFISRKREFLADETGAILTGNPHGLASALRKLAQDKIPIKKPHQATAHLFISNPFKGVSNIFTTHPDINERIRRLENMKVL